MLIFRGVQILFLDLDCFCSIHGFLGWGLSLQLGYPEVGFLGLERTLGGSFEVVHNHGRFRTPSKWPAKHGGNKSNQIPFLDVSKNWGFSPQTIHFHRVFHCKPSIFGYSYCWKHPYNPFRILVNPYIIPKTLMTLRQQCR